jgi:hypothetical protein
MSRLSLSRCLPQIANVGLLAASFGHLLFQRGRFRQNHLVIDQRQIDQRVAEGRGVANVAMRVKLSSVRSHA